MTCTDIDRKFINLHPKFIGPCKRLHEDLTTLYKSGHSEFRFELFEGFRSPERQARVLSENASKAGPWESAHQYGLGADFVPFLSQAEAEALGVRPGWHWPKPTDKCWIMLKKHAERCGLVVPIAWDLNHVQHPMFAQWRRIMMNWD